MEKNDFSLQISPVLTRIKIYVSTASATVRVKNTTSKDIVLRLQLQPIKPSLNQDGSLSLTNTLLGPDKAFLRKIKIFDGEKEVKTLKITPFEEKTLILKLNLNNKLTPGDYYFSLLFISSPGINQTTSLSRVVAEVASNFLISVRPPEAKLFEIKISSPIFLTNGPLPIKVLINNPSDTLLTTSGKIYVSNMFGQTVGSISLTNKYVLSKSERYITSSQANNVSNHIKILQDSSKTAYWNENFLLGLYTLKAEIKEQETGQVKTTETRFLVVPLFIIIILVVVAFILGGVYLRVKKKI